MPYRDPAQRAAWMREYRRQKRVERTSLPVLPPSPPSIVRAPEPSGVLADIIESTSPQPSPRTPGFRERVPGTALKLRWNWRELFLLGSSPPGFAHIAITPAIVRPAHGAAIVERER